MVNGGFCLVGNGGLLSQQRDIFPSSIHLIITNTQWESFRFARDFSSFTTESSTSRKPPQPWLVTLSLGQEEKALFTGMKAHYISVSSWLYFSWRSRLSQSDHFYLSTAISFIELLVAQRKLLPFDHHCLSYSLDVSWGCRSVEASLDGVQDGFS